MRQRLRCVGARLDGGFTLIELLIAVTLLGLIVAALASAMIVSFQTIDSARQGVSDSAGAQILSAYLVTDVQASDEVMPAIPAGCPGITSGTVALDLSWKDAANVAAGAASPATTYVLYQTESDGAGDTRLERYVFSVNTSGTCSLVSQKTMVPAVSSVTCTTPCDNAATTLGLNVTAKSTQPKTGFYTQYVFKLTGSRRVT